MSREYIAFNYQDKVIYVWDQGDHDQRNEIEHAIVVGNGRAAVITSCERVTIPDTVALVERSYKESQTNTFGSVR